MKPLLMLTALMGLFSFSANATNNQDNRLCDSGYRVYVNEVGIDWSGRLYARTSKDVNDTTQKVIFESEHPLDGTSTGGHQMALLMSAMNLRSPVQFICRNFYSRSFLGVSAQNK